MEVMTQSTSPMQDQAPNEKPAKGMLVVILLIILLLVVAGVAYWELAPGSNPSSSDLESPSAPGTSQSDTTSLEQDLKAVGDVDVDAEFKGVDQDIKSL